MSFVIQDPPEVIEKSPCHAFFMQLLHGLQGGGVCGELLGLVSLGMCAFQGDGQ